MSRNIMHFLPTVYIALIVNERTSEHWIVSFPRIIIKIQEKILFEINMATSILSPLAHPFHPALGEDLNPTIYNDGIPSMTFGGSQSDFLLTLADETIDEAFPPNAAEAAELEDAEIFVDLMASLDFLEEKEEATRTNYAGLKKRWKARRELVKRPRPPKHLVKKVLHGDPRLLDSEEIVLYDQSHNVLEHRMLAKETLRLAKPHVAKRIASKLHHTKPIQQPRKQN